jgi:hypothetical protein
MAVLSGKDRQILGARGVEVVSDSFGTRYTFSLQGLFWLLNYLLEAQPEKTSFSIGLLKALATVQPTDNWRELRVKACDLPAYNSNYQQLAIYLNGSPPRKLLNTHAALGVPQTFDLLEARPFTHAKIAQGSEVHVVISSAEKERLASGECLEFKA